VDLSNAASKRVGLPRHDSADLARQILDEIRSTPADGKTVKLSSFGMFSVRDKAKRVGRNPKTGEVVPVEARQSITFSPSPVLKARVYGSQEKPAQGRAELGSVFGGLIRNSAYCCYSYQS
jgi:integration host factor subunit alpha